MVIFAPTLLIAQRKKLKLLAIYSNTYFILRKVFAEGFYLIDGDRKINQGIFEITIEPGRCELFLLGIDLKRDFRELSFPPKGIKM